MPIKTVDLTRDYTRQELRDCWDFSRHDFENFLDLMEWLTDLPRGACKEQLRSARFIAKHREPVAVEKVRLPVSIRTLRPRVRGTDSLTHLPSERLAALASEAHQLIMILLF